jgi:hypothetical protein
VTTSSAFIAQELAEVLVGIIFAGLSAAVTGWLWPGTGLAVFITFLVSWELEGINTKALKRRHPELILSPVWRWVRIRYKPLHLGEHEYEVTLSKYIRGGIALIIMGIPLSLFVAGLVGKFWLWIR